jgi:hypothetical protein
MGRLVGDSIDNIILEHGVGGLLVEEEFNDTEGDQTPVLHGAMGELVNIDQIGLGERVVNLEDLRKVIDDLRGVFEGPVTLLLETTGSVDTDGDLLAIVASLSVSLDVLEVTESLDQEIGAHSGRGLEGDHVPPIVGGLGLLDRHVAQSNLVNGDLNLKVKGGLEVGLVEAWESSARIAGLELGAQHVVPVVVGGHGSGGGGGRLILAAVETSQLVVHDGLELDGDGSLLGDGQLLVEGDGGTLGLLIVAETGGLESLGALGLVESDGGLEEFELQGVENDVLGGLDDLELDAGQGLSIKVTVVVWHLPPPG